MRNLLLILLLAIFITLFLQNLSPSLSIAFLALKSPSLPWGFWLLLSLLIGVSISLISTVLLSLLLPLRKGKIFPKVSVKNSPPFPADSPHDTSPKTVQKKDISPPSDSPRPHPQEEDDWGENDWVSEEWEETLTPPSPSPSPSPSSQDYEVKKEPKTQSWSGSTYSFGYKDKEIQNSGVGKTESVYDADYRVIIPPFRQPPIHDDEDWGLAENDQESDEKENKNS